jgi:DNA-binding transcriptional ArsR family regulator
VTRTASHAGLSDEALGLVAARFRLLADPTRLRILRELLPGECTVTELAARLRVQQPTVSKHLAALRSEGVVARRQEGLHAFYRVADPSVARLCDIVCRGLARRLAGHLDALPRAARSAARRGSDG